MERSACRAFMCVGGASKILDSHSNQTRRVGIGKVDIQWHIVRRDDFFLLASCLRKKFLLSFRAAFEMLRFPVYFFKLQHVVFRMNQTLHYSALDQAIRA